MNLNSSNAVQILLLIGGLTLVPALLFTVTGFTRILIVLGFIRTARRHADSAPPNQVLVGHRAVPDDVRDGADASARSRRTRSNRSDAHKISTTVALERAEEPLREFMFTQTRVAGHLAVRQPRARQAAAQTRADVPT